MSLPHVPGTRTPPLFPYTTLFRSPRRPLQRPLTFAAPRGCSLLRRERRVDAAPGLGDLARVCLRRLRLRVDFGDRASRSEEHTSELQSPMYLVCRLLLEKKNKDNQ